MTQPLKAGRTFDRDEVAVYAAAAASLLGLSLKEEHREGVVTNLCLIFDQTTELMSLELDWNDEAAPVFYP